MLGLTPAGPTDLLRGADVLRTSGHRSRRRRRLLQATTASLIAMSASAFLNGSLAASPTPEREPRSIAIGTAAHSTFPSAEEMSAVVGLEMEASGANDGLSQLWEGIEFDWQTLPRAQTAIYLAPVVGSDIPTIGVIVDIAEFAAVADAVQHIDDVVLADDPSGFETDLVGDFVAGTSVESDDGMSASYIFLREGPVVMAVSVFATDGTDVAAAAEAVVRLVQERVDGSIPATVAQSSPPPPEAEWRRFEFGDEGFAIHLPQGWASLPPSLVGEDSMVALFHSPVSGTCGVLKDPSAGATTLDEVMDEYIPTGYWAALPDGYSAEIVRTTAGDAARVTFNEARPDIEGVFRNAIYFFPVNDALFTVPCNIGSKVSDGVADDWLSIAGTLEFLPEPAPSVAARE